MALPLAAGLVVLLACSARAQTPPEVFKAALVQDFAKGEDLSKLDAAGQPATISQLLEQAKYVQAGREPGDEPETHIAFVRSVARRLGTSRDAAVALYGQRVRQRRAVPAAPSELDTRAAIALDVARNPGISEAKRKRMRRDLAATSDMLSRGMNGDAGFIPAAEQAPAQIVARPVMYQDPEAPRNWSSVLPRVQPTRLVTNPTPPPDVSPSSGWSLASVSATLDSWGESVADAGRSIRNKFYAGKELIKDGFGYIFRPGRTTNWGVEGLVDGLRKIAAYMLGSGRASTDMYVGDLSSANGGQLGGHKSHRRGRDVDIGFYATDEAGRPVNLGFVSFTAGKDRLTGWNGRQKVRFDAKRNWYLVQAILANDDPDFKPTNIFIAKHLETAILAEATDPAQRARAAGLMSYWPGHDNHLHLRVE